MVHDHDDDEMIGQILIEVDEWIMVTIKTEDVKTVRLSSQNLTYKIDYV